MKKVSHILLTLLLTFSLLLIPENVQASSGATQVVLGSASGTAVILNAATPYYDQTNGKAVSTGTLGQNGITAFLDFGETQPVLYVNGLQISGYAVEELTGTSAALYADGALTLDLTGSNTVGTGSASVDALGYGMRVTGSLTVRSSSNGSLSVTENGSGKNSCALEAAGIYMVGGSLTATGGAAAGESYGVQSSGTISVSGGMLNGIGGTVTGEFSFSYGVRAGNGISVNGGSLYGTAGTAAPSAQLSYSYGIFTVNGVNASSGTVKGQGGKAVSISSGICCQGISVAGAKVYAAGGMTTGGQGSSYGLDCADSSGKITVSAGVLEAVGGSSAGEMYGTSNGIYHNGPMTISGGTLLAKSDKDTTVSVAHFTMTEGNNPVVTASHYRWRVGENLSYEYHSPEQPQPCVAWYDNYIEIVCGIYSEPETQPTETNPSESETQPTETVPTESETQPTESVPSQTETQPSETLPSEAETENTSEQTIKELALAVGQKKKLNVKVPDGLTDAKITYKSSRKSVAKVSKTGRVTALKTGETKITVQADSRVIGIYEVTVTAKIGTVKTIGKARYKVNGAGTAAYVKSTNTKATKITIPATVKFGKQTYKVTEISKNAFKDNKKITKVTIGKNVKKIQAGAFRNASKLKSVVIKSKNLKSVGKNALKGIHSKAVIKVPDGKVKAYKALLKGKIPGKASVKS